ncbi:LPS assembly lipoprotein LptE [Paracoccaceae bacterium]|nr:LPS assembly lipoprotein LptE [Paracoccaceae bacterium]
MKIFRDIDIGKEETPLAFLIQEALLEKAPFEKSGQNLLSISPAIKNSYGVITTENEITRYSVTLDVEYSLSNKETKEIFIKNNVSATSDYSAAVTFTGFATEIARRDTYERLADTIAEKMITEILINNQIKYSP